ncbi:Do family serine endopeptidase [Bacteroides sedimenti]|uniref:Serine protease n=1 Tax=Bacteroides sedimenti TaxID=2136147 RepID=A0ABN6Z1D2_9BACE
MKQTTKNILGLGFVVAISSGVAGVTTYSLVAPKKGNTSYEEMFQQNPNVRRASFNASEGGPVDLTFAAENSIHAVVHIKSTINAKTTTVEVQDPFADFFGDFFGNGGGRQQRKVQQPPKVGIGSGVIISKDGYIVTNNHVIDDSDVITVTLNDKREFKARLIGADAATDLALIKIEGNDFPTLPVGNSDDLKVGEWVLAVGNPLNLSSTVTAGIVSAKARNLGMGGGGIESFIQTDAAINQGNSGGALVNTRGELIGINSAIYSPTGSYAGYGFAIPTTIMKKVVADLKEYGTVQRALLGIKGGDNSAELSKEKDLGVIDGVYVDEVTEGGSAADAGLKQKDVIVGINGKEIKSMAELQETITRLTPGTKIKVKIIRDKKEKTIDVTLKNSQGTTKVVKNAGMEILGAAFREVPNDLKEQLKLSYGLEVTGLESGKMKEAGITKGFIILKANGQPVKSTSDLENILKAATQSPEQVLFMTGMYPSGKRANFAVDLSSKE